MESRCGRVGSVGRGVDRGEEGRQVVEAAGDAPHHRHAVLVQRSRLPEDDATALGLLGAKTLPR
jgi:hypothetical protein